MVVTFLPLAAESGITQERIGSPSRCTVHAPHCASPQPKCGLLILRSLRSAYRSGMLGSALTVADLPSTVNLMLAMKPPLDVRPSGIRAVRCRETSVDPGQCRRNAIAAFAAVVRYAVDFGEEELQRCRRAPAKPGSISGGSG